MKNIIEIRKTAISELTDEEIVKGTLDRLKSLSVLIVYQNDDGGYVLLGRYKQGGRHMLDVLRTAWEEKFGKIERIKKDE